MEKRFEFHPPRRAGLSFQAVVLAGLGLVIGLGLRQAAQAQSSPAFGLYLLPVLLAAILILLFAYFAYALYRSVYVLEQDGLHLHWGLRVEVIPMDVILGMRMLPEDAPRPRLRLPGSVLGIRQTQDAGKIEYMAARSRKLVLVRTSRRSYAISPANPEAFLSAYRQVAEFGSLYPIAAESVYPSFLLANLWSDRLGRSLVLGGLALSLLMVLGVSLVVPFRPEITLGFNALGAPRDPVPAVRLMLLPILNGFTWVIDLIAGLYFYRREERRWLAILVWGGGLITGLLFLVSILITL